jgi:hypothetical protein
MPPKFKRDFGFNIEEPSSTRVDIPIPQEENPYAYGSIQKSDYNLIDKISNLFPDTGPTGLLKGLYRGTDRNLFGLLPSGNYETPSPEADLGKAMSIIADPIAGAKGVKYAVSGGTPISRLIANSIKPQDYMNKLPEFMRVLTNPKVFKEAVIDDIPQYVLKAHNEDRLFAWRTKFGLGKPNPIYNKPLSYQQKAQSVNYSSYKYLKENPQLGHSAEVIKRYEENLPIDRLWNKFGTHMEGGKKYYHYKDSDDYFSKIEEYGGLGNFHGLFGGYNRTRKVKGNVVRENYYDNWNFARNKPIIQFKKNKIQAIGKGGQNIARGDFATLLQRRLAEALLRPLEFKGTATKYKDL